MAENSRQSPRHQAPRSTGPNRGANQGQSQDWRNQRKRRPEKHWLWGHHAVEMALKNPLRKAKRLLVYPDLLEALEPILDQLDIPPAIKAATKPEIDGVLPDGAVHQGYALECNPHPSLTLDELYQRKLETRRLLVALDQVTDPHNVGAIWRSAAAFGAGGMIMTDRHSPQETGVMAKTACGALEVVPPVRVGNLSDTLEKLKTRDYRLIGLAGEVKTLLPALEEHPLNILVLGAEGTGMRQRTRETCSVLVKLPTQPPIEHLNVSNAAAIALYALAHKN